MFAAKIVMPLVRLGNSEVFTYVFNTETHLASAPEINNPLYINNLRLNLGNMMDKEKNTPSYVNIDFSSDLIHGMDCNVLYIRDNISQRQVIFRQLQQNQRTPHIPK